jgi:hypothetical protein
MTAAFELITSDIVERMRNSPTPTPGEARERVKLENGNGNKKKGEVCCSGSKNKNDV